MSDLSADYNNLDDALAGLEVHSVASSSVVASTTHAAMAPATPVTVQGTSGGLDDASVVGVVLIEPDSTMCCGIVGNPGRICLMEKKEGLDSCGVSHRGGCLKNKVAGLYIKERNSKTAHLTPVLETDRLAAKEDVDWLIDQTATTKQWTKLFSIYSTASNLMKEEVERRLVMINNPSPMVTPWKASLDPEQIIDLPNKEDNYYEKMDSDTKHHLEQTTMLKCAAMIEQLDTGLAQVSASLNGIARDVNDYAVITDQNMEKAETSLNLLRTQLGNPVSLNGHDFPDVWSALDYVDSKATAATVVRSDGPTKGEWSKAKGKLASLTRDATKNHEGSSE